jgi:hypothetical protein
MAMTIQTGMKASAKLNNGITWIDLVIEFGTRMINKVVCRYRGGFEDCQAVKYSIMRKF